MTTCYYDVAVVVTLWNYAQTTINKLLWLLFHQRQLRRKDKKEAALLAPVELVSPCILAGEENVAPKEEEEEEEKVENALKIFFLLL